MSDDARPQIVPPSDDAVRVQTAHDQEDWALLHKLVVANGTVTAAHIAALARLAGIAGF